MIAVSTVMNSRKDQSFTRSARAPETMEAVVATNTIWKNQSDIVALPFATTAAPALSAPSAPASNATSSAEVP